jgi:hypothetical protein
MRHLLLLLAALPLFAIPSQKDALSSAKRQAQGAHVAAQRSKDSAQFIAAANGLQEVGRKVIAANQTAMSSIRASYPADVKSRTAQQTWDKKMADIRRDLSAANESLEQFFLPTELSPESVRAVDRYIRAIDLAIEAHHAACLNIR